jgi:hypothetical protein
MSKKTILLLSLMSVAVLSLALLLVASAVGGASFTTFNTHVDGNDVCKQTEINCNHYGAKEYVWLNGGPDANHLKPDGEYFFAVLEPGGQPNPNDADSVPDTPYTQTPKNLSDDFDAYTNRTFTVTGGEVSAYSGDHWLDSGRNEPGPGDPKPNNLPPYIRLFPYSDTRNPGGVYIMAICYIGVDGSEYPVDPRDCKYDAFKVVKGAEEKKFQFMLSGFKFNDYNQDGIFDSSEPGLDGWVITIDGYGAAGEEIHTTETTDADGYWEYTSQSYMFNGKNKQQTVDLLVCEELQDGWVQSPINNQASSQEADITVEDGCYRVVIPPDGAEFASVFMLNFGNTPRGELSGGKYYDSNENGQHDAGEPWLEGWEITYDSSSVYTDASGMFAVTVEPGSYDFAEVLGANGWMQTGNLVDQSTTTGGATVDLASYIYTVNVPNDQPSTVDGLYFGNVCKVTPGGRTPGFWQNNNGQELLAANLGWLADLRALNLVDELGNDFDPYTPEDVANWILSDAGQNMAWKLSSFVAADTLNVLAGFTDPSVYAYGETVGYWIDYGNTLLGLDPLTPPGDEPNRSQQAYVKNILDQVANNYSFVQPAPGTACGVPYP